MTKCTTCGREYKYNHKAGHTKTRCNSCVVNSRRYKVKLRAVQYKGGKCERCGYDKSLRALSFHHLDKSTKEFGIGGSACKNWNIIQQELDKCILLCANCHMEEEEKLTIAD